MRAVWEPVFFLALRRYGKVSLAVSVAGVSRALVYQLRDKDERFAARWEATLQAHAEAERAALMQRLLGT